MHLKMLKLEIEYNEQNFQKEIKTMRIQLKNNLKRYEILST